MNCDKKEGSLLEEKIYDDMDIDAEMFIDTVLSTPEDEILANTPGWIKNFPNTYTFTKNLGERLLRKNRGTMPLVIVRPAIIGCSWFEPSPGWIDTISAAGALFMTCALGILKSLPGDWHCIGD